MGWSGQALLGQAADWRAHIIVTGPYGSGKSWLANTVCRVMGDAAQPQVNDFTKAGLQQKYNQQARPLILDEAEPHSGQGDQGRVEMVVETLRNMSSGVGATVLRGSSEGRSRSSGVVGAAYLSSILPVPMQPQDRSRFTSVDLLDLRPNGRPSQVEAEAEAMAAMSAAFRTRAIVGRLRFRENFTIWRAVLISCGMSPRDSDQLATILAGRDMMLQDTPTDQALAEKEAAGPLAELITEPVRDEMADEGAQCLAHLYTSASDSWINGQKMTFDELILSVRRGGDNSSDAAKLLGRSGLKLKLNGADGPVLLVANQHQGLENVFKGTRWAKGVWRQALLYLDGVEPYSKKTTSLPRFHKEKRRAVVIPTSLLPSEDEAAEEVDDDIPF